MLETRKLSLNGHTSGLHPQRQKLEPPCTADNIKTYGKRAFSIIVPVLRDNLPYPNLVVLLREGGGGGEKGYT